MQLLTKTEAKRYKRVGAKIVRVRHNYYLAEVYEGYGYERKQGSKRHF